MAGGFGRRPSPGAAFTPKDSLGLKYPQLDKRVIKDFISQHSVQIAYWKAIECPCTTPETGQPNMACNSCRGLGWFYGDCEDADIYKKAQITSRTSKKLNNEGGWMTTGHASITFLPGVIPADGDLIQALNDVEVINDEYHIVGSKLQDGTSDETLRFRDVKCIERVLLYLRQTRTAEVVDPSKYQFNPDTRIIDFKGNLAVGTEYSVRYKAAPEYICRGETSRPLLRVAKDDEALEPGRSTNDVVYPFNVLAVRLDRALLQRQRGSIDQGKTNTFNTGAGGSPFR